MTADPDSERPSLTTLVRGARRGLRRDVAALEGALDDETLLIPLARGIPDVPEGEAQALDRDLTLSPHLLRDADGGRHVALFTHHELAAASGEHFGWQTDGEELSVCAMPARVALELARDLVDESDVLGLVLDPASDSELMLRRSEIASIVAGAPIPLVGYIADLPPLGDEQVRVAEPAEPPPAEFVAELERCLGDSPEVLGHSLARTFNPERDLEPHLTLTLRAAEGVDRRSIAERVIAAVGEKLPPPGYLDIVFEDD